LIPWRHFQIVQRDRRVQNSEFLKSPQLQICWETAASARLPQPFGFPVPETRDHFKHYTNVMRYYCQTATFEMR
jgi:hypothetical protein